MQIFLSWHILWASRRHRAYFLPVPHTQQNLQDRRFPFYFVDLPHDCHRGTGMYGRTSSEHGHDILHVCCQYIQRVVFANAVCLHTIQATPTQDGVYMHTRHRRGPCYSLNSCHLPLRTQLRNSPHEINRTDSNIATFECGGHTCHL